jgi:hypothetical protein
MDLPEPGGPIMIKISPIIQERQMSDFQKFIIFYTLLYSILPQKLAA